MQTSARLAAISAVILLLSLGLCGFSIKYASTMNTGTLIWLSGAGLLLGALGLFVSAIMAIVQVTRRPRPPQPPPPPR